MSEYIKAVFLTFLIHFFRSFLFRLPPMDSSSNEVAVEFPNLFRLFENGTIERLQPIERVPPSTNPSTGVKSRDVVISSDTGVSARIFLPKLSDQTQKLPLVIYFHGGAFCMGSPFSAFYNHHVSSLADKANVIAVSVHYRLAPEHLLPTAYEDSWSALQWVATHSAGGGPENWLNNHADFERVFLMGDSAGANVAYSVASQAGSYVNDLEGLKIEGMILVHPYFLSAGPDKLIEILYPSSGGLDNPRLYPISNPNLWKLASSRVKVFIAEKDRLKERGLVFYETLRQSGWKGEIEIMETEGEGHVFHLFRPNSDKALDLLKQFASFVNDP